MVVSSLCKKVSHPDFTVWAEEPPPTFQLRAGQFHQEEYLHFYNEVVILNFSASWFLGDQYLTKQKFKPGDHEVFLKSHLEYMNASDETSDGFRNPIRARFLEYQEIFFLIKEKHWIVVRDKVGEKFGGNMEEIFEKPGIQKTAYSFGVIAIALVETSFKMMLRKFDMRSYGKLY